MVKSRGKLPKRLFLLSLLLFVIALAVGVYADTQQHIDDTVAAQETILASVSAYLALSSAICFALSVLVAIFSRRRPSRSGWN